MYYFIKMYNIISITNQIFINIKNFIINQINKESNARSTENNKLNIYLQFTYLAISVASALCVYNNYYLVDCSNIVGFFCLFDFCYIKKKDMILHHIFVLLMIHYMNNHNTYKKDYLVKQILSTEISSIFLLNNSLLSNNLLFKNKYMNFIKIFNGILFITTFFYYRIYNYYYYLLLDNDINIIFYLQSKNLFEFYEIYVGMYGLFILNIYWSILISIKYIKLLQKWE